MLPPEILVVPPASVTRATSGVVFPTAPPNVVRPLESADSA